MTQYIERRQAAIRFKRYSRKSYAAFVSMHREVTIGAVASYIADSQLQKAKSAHSAENNAHKNEKQTELQGEKQREYDLTVMPAAEMACALFSFVAEPAAADFSNLNSISKKPGRRCMDELPYAASLLCVYRRTRLTRRVRALPASGRWSAGVRPMSAAISISRGTENLPTEKQHSTLFIKR